MHGNIQLDAVYLPCGHFSRLTRSVNLCAIRKTYVLDDDGELCPSLTSDVAACGNKLAL